MLNLTRKVSKKSLVTLSLLMSALILAGCGESKNAATMKDTTITVADLQRSVSTILNERLTFGSTPEDGYFGKELTLNQLEFKIYSTLLTQGAKKFKLSVLQAEVDGRRNEILQNVGGEEQLSVALVKAGIASIDFEHYLRLIILQEKLRPIISPNANNDGEIVQALQRLMTNTATLQNLIINPRYGKWSSESNKIEPVDLTNGALTPENSTK